MIVCSCNLITDTQIREALARPDAPTRVREVYGALGCAAKCGGCASAINRLIEDARREKEQLAAARRDAA